MGNDGMALLVVLGLGGLVLWYLTKTPATRPVTTQGQPCVLGGSYGGVGVQASCGAIEKGFELLQKGGSLALKGLESFNPFDSKPQATYEQFQTWKKSLIASGGTPPTGCGGWRGPCPPPGPLNSETQVSAKPLYPIGKPAGFR